MTWTKFCLLQCPLEFQLKTAQEREDEKKGEKEDEDVIEEEYDVFVIKECCDLIKGRDWEQRLESSGTDDLVIYCVV